MYKFFEREFFRKLKFKFVKCLMCIFLHIGFVRIDLQQEFSCYCLGSLVFPSVIVPKS